MNQVNLIGRLVKNPKTGITESGKTYARFSLAVERSYKSKITNKHPVDFIQIVVWNRLAEIVKTYLKKGKRISVQGRIQTSFFESKFGTRVYTTEIYATNIEFLDTMKDNTGAISNNRRF